MIDKDLDRNIVQTQEFLDLWVKFFDMMVAARRTEELTPQHETAFLAVKSELARRHKVLEQNLGTDYNLDANTMNIVGQAISLASLCSSSDIAMKKMENEWHRVYISINETLGVLQNRRQDMANKSQFEVFMDRFKGGAGGKGFLVLVIIVLVVVVGVGLIKMGLLSAFTSWYKQLLGMR